MPQHPVTQNPCDVAPLVVVAPEGIPEPEGTTGDRNGQQAYTTAYTKVRTLSAPRRPVLRYHGGKWKLAPWLLTFFPAHRVYVEPFGGGASVLIRKPRSYAEVYNDLDGEVVNLFRVLRDPTAALRLRELLMLTPFAREEFEDAYTPSVDPVERARRSVIRAFMGFGSASFNAGHATGFRTYTDGARKRTEVVWLNDACAAALDASRAQGSLIA